MHKIRTCQSVARIEDRPPNMWVPPGIMPLRMCHLMPVSSAKVVRGGACLCTLWQSRCTPWCYIKWSLPQRWQNWSLKKSNIMWMRLTVAAKCCLDLQSRSKVLDHSGVFIRNFPLPIFNVDPHDSILRGEFGITIPSYNGQKILILVQ